MHALWPNAGSNQTYCNLYESALLERVDNACPHNGYNIIYKY